MIRRWMTGLAAVLLGVATVAAAPDEAASPAESRGSEYVVGVQDVLYVNVWGEPELSMKIQVRPDGKVTLPLVNDLYVVGLTPDQIRQKITEALSQFINDPSVTVISEEINSFNIYFLGEVNTQGEMKFYRPVRLIQAIASAGGLTQFAKKEIVLLREEFGIEKRISIDYKKLLAGDPAQENIYLKPGDTLLFL